MKTVLIKTNGDIQVVKVNPGAQSFREFQRITGQGWAEYVCPRFGGEEAKGLVFVCDEEGLWKDLRPNPWASYIYGADLHRHLIVGDVILMHQELTADGPEYVFFKDEEIPALMKRVKAIASKVASSYGVEFSYIKEEA